MTSSDTALHDHDALIAELTSMQERLALLAEHWKSAGCDHEADLTRAKDEEE